MPSRQEYEQGSVLQYRKPGDSKGRGSRRPFVRHVCWSRMDKFAGRPFRQLTNQPGFRLPRLCRNSSSRPSPIKRGARRDPGSPGFIEFFWVPDLITFVRNDVSEITTQSLSPGWRNQPLGETTNCRGTARRAPTQKKWEGSSRGTFFKRFPLVSDYGRFSWGGSEGRLFAKKEPLRWIRSNALLSVSAAAGRFDTDHVLLWTGFH